MLPNHSCFGAIAGEHFLERTRLLSSLEKRYSSVLRKEFHRHCRRFLEDFVSTIFSTVAARSPAGQGLSCSCPETIIGGDGYSAFYVFGQLLDELPELGWLRGSEIEPAKAHFHFLSVNSGRWNRVAKGLPISRAFAFCNQPGFRSRRTLHKFSIMVLYIITMFS